MTETVAQAAELATAAPKMISPDTFAQVLPAHIPPEKYTRWALTLMRDPKMIEVARTEPGRLSIVTALMDCASLGLEPGRTYHLVPFGGQVEGIIDYKGEIQLITNASPAASVVALLVRKGDDFHLTGANIPPRHDADWFDEDARGPVTGGYSYVDYGGRYSLVVRMSEAKFLQHRGKAKTKAMWDEWPDEMRVKTLIRQLRKTEPWSAEVRQP
jgi:recombination protein RecT